MNLNQKPLHNSAVFVITTRRDVTNLTVQCLIKVVQHNILKLECLLFAMFFQVDHSLTYLELEVKTTII